MGDWKIINFSKRADKKGDCDFLGGREVVQPFVLTMGSPGLLKKIDESSISIAITHSSVIFSSENDFSKHHVTKLMISPINFICSGLSLM